MDSSKSLKKTSEQIELIKNYLETQWSSLGPRDERLTVQDPASFTCSGYTASWEEKDCDPENELRASIWPISQDSSIHFINTAFST